jgi:hypothetical protein
VPNRWHLLDAESFSGYWDPAENLVAVAGNLRSGLLLQIPQISIKDRSVAARVQIPWKGGWLLDFPPPW